jgi:chorismate mutase/prephenate dehydratase
LSQDIEDFPFNETRFAVIGQHDVAKTGHDKTAIMFKVPHAPGALADALNIFKSNKINLTWIESFPSRSTKPEYVFFADFEGHSDDPKSKRALTSLEGTCEEVTVLGSFPMASVDND